MNSAGATEDRLAVLACKRLEKFAALIPRIVVSDDSEIIHDARVASRRAQQIFKVLAPRAARKNKQRKLMRDLRNIRKILGRPRNLDVVLESVAEKLDRAANPVMRDGWDQLRTHLKAQRTRAVTRAREELGCFDIVKLAARGRAIIAGAADGEPAKESLKEGVTAALSAWRDTIATARGKLGVEEVHTLRIAGKRLRYRLELLAELADGGAKARVKSLRVLQDQLGAWNDSQVLLKTCAKFLSRRDFLGMYPGPARALLLEMERERRRANGAIEGLIRRAEKVSLAFGEDAVPASNEQVTDALTG
jgi:CHAD domain-containing protein